MASDLNIILNEVQSLVQHFESISVENSHIEDMPMHVALDTITTGNPGRPAFVIPSSQIEDMLQIGLNFEQISTILGISTRTRHHHTIMPSAVSYMQLRIVQLARIHRHMLSCCTGYAYVIHLHARTYNYMYVSCDELERNFAH